MVSRTWNDHIFIGKWVHWIVMSDFKPEIAVWSKLHVALCSEKKHQNRRKTESDDKNWHHTGQKNTKIDAKQSQMIKTDMIQDIDVSESIFSDRFMTRSRINALTAHAQRLLSCLKHTALDRLWVCLNAILVSLYLVVLWYLCCYVVVLFVW